MKSLLSLAGIFAATALFTGCVTERPIYRHRDRGAYYYGDSGYGRGTDVVIYDNDRGYDRHHYGDYYGVNRTNVRERNVYRTNVYENNRRISATRTPVTHRHPQVKVVKKGKKKHKGHDNDQDHQ
jgi:hypothetical protein